MSGLRVLVCGGRDYADRTHVYRVLDFYRRKRPGIALIITGGATGVDAIAYNWALDRAVGALQFFADWKGHGRRAGPLRNQRMLDEGKPDLIVAFPGGRGTADMVGRANKAGVHVLEATSPASPVQEDE